MQEEYNEIKERLIHLKSVGVNVVVVPYYEAEIRAGNKNINDYHHQYEEGSVNNYISYENRIEEYTNANLLSEVRKYQGYKKNLESNVTSADRLFIFVFKNTTIEQLTRQVDVAELLLEKFHENYLDSEIYDDIEKNFGVSYKPKKQQVSNKDEVPKNFKQFLFNKSKPGLRGVQLDAITYQQEMLENVIYDPSKVVVTSIPNGSPYDYITGADTSFDGPRRDQDVVESRMEWKTALKQPSLKEDAAIEEELEMRAVQQTEIEQEDF